MKKNILWKKHLKSEDANDATKIYRKKKVI